jgi:hypothetical protein
LSNQLYEFTMRVSRGDGCELPEGMQGAYVPCYAGASDYQTALKKGVAAIAHMHFAFNDIKGDVREIPVVTWAGYVAKVWPEFAGRFPTQEQLPSLVEQGAVFFGPFAAFKS